MCHFFFSSRRRHTRYWRDWSSDVCSSDLCSGPPLPDPDPPRSVVFTSSTTSAASRGFPLVVLAALFWGTSGVSGRIVADRTDLGPLDIAWHRMALGAAVLLAGYLLTRRRAQSTAVPLTRPLAVRLTLVAAGLAVYQLAYFAAVAAAGVSVATLVALGLAPLLIALGGTAFGAGRPDRATSTALAVALVGLVLLVGLTAGASAGTDRKSVV